MNKLRITNHQIFALTACFTCGSAPLAISASIAGLANQDAWISMLISLVFGLFLIWMICILWSNYPGMTYIEMMKRIFGNFAGSIIAVGFLFFCFVADSQVVYYIGKFITIQAMSKTPPYIINIAFFTTVVIAMLYGLEVVGRSYDILIFFVSILFMLSMIVVLPSAKLENLQPVLEKGIIPILKGAILASSFLIFPIIVLLMILPVNTDNTIEAKKSFIKGYFWGGFLIFISILVSILVLGGEITAATQYPVYMLAKEIRVGEIFTRLEFSVVGVWIVTLLARAIIYFYALLIGLQKILKLKDHKKIILPIGLIIVVMSQVVYTNTIHQSVWDTFVWPPFVATFGLLLPVAMVIGFYLKK